MAQNSKIEWTHHTVNLWWGCTKVHEGCDNCYAEALSNRFGENVWGNDQPRREVKSAFKDLNKYQKLAKEATELAKELGKMQSGYFKSFKSKIEDSYEMEEGPEKQKLIKEIYSQAEEIIKKYKADKETVLNKKTPN